MSLTTTATTEIIRTERGLTIAGTRITLYDVMDHWVAGRSPAVILKWLPLTEAELQVALDYIEANRETVDVEYQAVLRTTAELRHDWQERNSDRLVEIAAIPVPPEKAALWEKLQAQKARTAAE